MKKRCFHGLVLLLTCFACAAQDNLLFKTFSFSKGLTTYNIFKTRQDSHGFIWVCTQDGLFRFNGHSFEVIKNNTESNTATMGNVFLDMTIGAGDTIYAADYYYGIDAIDATSWGVTHIGGVAGKKRNLLPNYWVEKILSDKQHNLWIGGKGYIAFKSSKDTQFKKVTRLPGFAKDIKVNFLKQVSGATVAVGVSGYGVLFYDTHTLTVSGEIKYQPGGILTEQINDLYVQGDSVFAITNSSVVSASVKSGKWIPGYTYRPSGLENVITTCITADSNGNLWIGTNSGLMCFNKNTGRAEMYKADKKKSYWLRDNFINDLFIDNQDNLWISTFNVLQMASLRGNRFHSYSGDKPGSDIMEHIYTIAAKTANEIFCTGVDGLYLTDLQTAQTKKIPGSSTLGLIHHIEKVDENCWILSADAGMFAYDLARQSISREALLKRFPEWAACKDNYFNTACKSNGATYWASEESEGMIKWDMANHRIIKFKAGTERTGGLIENHIRNIKVDNDGFLWVLSDATMSKFNAVKDTVEEVLYFNNDAASPNASMYFDMYDDSKTLWFASYGAGVCGYDKHKKTWTVISEKNGLSNNNVYGILPENDSIFWVSTNMGLSRVNHYSKSCSNYFYEDGLQDNSFDEKGALALSGKLLFGGINGFTAVDLTKKEQGNDVFPVYIHKLEYYSDNKKYTIRKLDWADISLPRGTTSIEIFLSALSFANNHKIRFGYRIEGINKEFADVGAGNSIILNALDYGTYRVSIRCSRPDGGYLEKMLYLSVFIEPKWYQTWWFKLALALTLGVIVYAFYRYRISQIKKQHEIRKNIATDLHDDLGSTLNSVKVFTNLAISGVNQKDNLQQVKNTLTEATTSLRDMIWVLDDSLDTVGELVTRLQQFALPVMAASNMESVIKAGNEVRNINLTKEEKRNLFLICKEAINNSIKYSGGTHIDVTIIPAGKRIKIVVSDQGKGFNVDEVQKGYGLKNMQYRAEQIKYAVTVSSFPGKGTQVEIKPAE